MQTSRLYFLTQSQQMFIPASPALSAFSTDNIKSKTLCKTHHAVLPAVNRSTAYIQSVDQTGVRVTMKGFVATLVLKDPVENMAEIIYVQESEIEPAFGFLTAMFSPHYAMKSSGKMEANWRSSAAGSLAPVLSGFTAWSQQMASEQHGHV